MTRRAAIRRYQTAADKALKAFHASQRQRIVNGDETIVRERLDEAYRWAREATSALHELFADDPGAAHVLARDWVNYSTMLGCPRDLIYQVAVPTG